MAKGDAGRMVNMAETIWGTEVRIVLTPQESRNLAFIKQYGPVPNEIGDILARMFGAALNDVAWEVASGVCVFPCPPGEAGFRGPLESGV